VELNRVHVGEPQGQAGEPQGQAGEPHRQADTPEAGDLPDEAHRLARRCAEIMLGADQAGAALGIRLEAVGPGSASVSMAVRADMTNGHRICHGGLIATLADTAFAVACNSYGEVSVAAGFDICFLESARFGDILIARASERARRGRSGLYDVSVLRRERPDTPATTIAEFRGRSRSLGRPIIPGASV